MQKLQAADHERLQSRFEAKETKIQMLRQRNSVKGKVGEDMGKTFLRGAFHHWEIRDTSKEAHATDIEIVVAENGARLLCEVKNRAVIPRQDVEHFVQDVRGCRSTNGGPVLSKCGHQTFPERAHWRLAATAPECPRQEASAARHGVNRPRRVVSFVFPVVRASLLRVVGRCGIVVVVVVVPLLLFQYPV